MRQITWRLCARQLFNIDRNRSWRPCASTASRWNGSRGWSCSWTWWRAAPIGSRAVPRPWAPFTRSGGCRGRSSWLTSTCRRCAPSARSSPPNSPKRSTATKGRGRANSGDYPSLLPGLSSPRSASPPSFISSYFQFGCAFYYEALPYFAPPLFDAPRLP